MLSGIDSLQKTLVKIDWVTGSIDTIATLRTEANATQYTAVVSDKNGGTGVGLVEIYRAPRLMSGAAIDL